MNFEFTFLNEYNSELDNYELIYENIAKVIFNHLNLNNFFIFEVDLVDAKTIHEINKNYRNVDRETDVISFAFEDEVEGSYKINKDINIPRVLGEIFISIDKAKEQAISYNHSFEREMSFLFVHGLLHLLGYDHMNKEDEEVMFKLQDEILDPLKL